MPPRGADLAHDDGMSNESIAGDTGDFPDNRVYLRGRLAGDPTERELPSGDVLLAFSLTVPRPPGEKVRVDSLECVAVRPGLRRIVGRASSGDELEIEGRLQRRFWRGPAGPASRYAVAVDAVRRVRPSTTKADPGRTARVTTSRRRAGA